jgi:hypothetical protein
VLSARRGLPSADAFANEMWQELGDLPNQRGEVPTRDVNLSGGPFIPCTRADIHAGLTYVVLTSMHRIKAKGGSVDPAR